LELEETIKKKHGLIVIEKTAGTTTGRKIEASRLVEFDRSLAIHALFLELDLERILCFGGCIFNDTTFGIFTLELVVDECNL